MLQRNTTRDGGGRRHSMSAPMAVPEIAGPAKSQSFHKKRTARRSERPKSREETPKEGSETSDKSLASPAKCRCAPHHLQGSFFALQKSRGA